MSVDILEPILARIRLIVGRCVVCACKYKGSELLSDIELVAGEKRRAVEFMQQYGFSSRPDGDVEGIALFIGGSRDNGVVVATRGACPKLEPGEVKVHSTFGSHVYLKKDGSIEIVSRGNVIVKTGPEGMGTLEVEGSIAATLDVKANSKTAPVSLAMHTHASAVGPTSPPTPGS